MVVGLRLKHDLHSYEKMVVRNQLEKGLASDCLVGETTYQYRGLIGCWSSRMIDHTGIETRLRLRRKGSLGQFSAMSYLFCLLD